MISSETFVSNVICASPKIHVALVVADIMVGAVSTWGRFRTARNAIKTTNYTQIRAAIRRSAEMRVVAMENASFQLLLWTLCVNAMACFCVSRIAVSAQKTLF